MKRALVDAGVPTARYATFDATQEAEAIAFLRDLPGFYVVKTDGLAAGKGVFVTESIKDAIDDVRQKLAGASFGDAGRRVVIEEGLVGPELSLLCLCDGERVVPLAPAQDYKRVGDGDQGPNTGGMGAYSPVPQVGQHEVDHILDTIVEPTVAWLRKNDIDYRGVLYAGLMLTHDGPKIIEYNVRFGDPEAQVVLPRDHERPRGASRRSRRREAGERALVRGRRRSDGDDVQRGLPDCATFWRRDRGTRWTCRRWKA